MKISATSSGGFAGLREHYEIDTEAHPAGHAIEAALAGAGFFSDARDSDAPVGADIPHWRITVEAPGARRTVTFAEDGGQAAARWQNLLAKLRASA